MADHAFVEAPTVGRRPTVRDAKARATVHVRTMGLDGTLLHVRRDHHAKVRVNLGGGRTRHVTTHTDDCVVLDGGGAG